nr:unnamed protein product [Callosobruchus chinensis]
MKIVKQKTTLDIEKNAFCEDDIKKRRHGVLFPSSIRCIIVGPSNCGKTNVMINLLEHINGPRFKNVYVHSKSLYQPKYVYLEELLRPLKGVKYFLFNASENIMHPSEARPNSTIIFDDVACDNQDVIREYFSMGRHNQIDSFYLCQTYAKILKHLIRYNFFSVWGLGFSFPHSCRSGLRLIVHPLSQDSDRVPSQILCELCDALDYAHLSSLLDNFQIRASSSAQCRTIEDYVFRLPLRTSCTEDFPHQSPISASAH